jgi:hypothetical protein
MKNTDGGRLLIGVFGEFNVKWSQLRGEHFSALSGIPQTTPAPASSPVSGKSAAPIPVRTVVPPPAQLLIGVQF